MLKQAYKFQLAGKPIFCAPYGGGHINNTYLLIDEAAQQYILQKINKHVFLDPVALMNNISLVTKHIQTKVQNHREALTIVPTLDGADWLLDEDGEYWRLYEFVSDSLCLDQSSSAEMLRESALAFGLFQQRLADFPAEQLTETIPHFHDTPNRYKTFFEALKTDSLNRKKDVEKEIEFFLEREKYAGTIMKLQSEGALPLRVTHNDTKLNNVLFDRKTKKALCVIDLDTVMPGISVNDYGDSIRFGATSATEDERDLSLVSFSVPLFEAYTSGYLFACGDSLSKTEIESLRDGAKMMTLECGLRFLTDYLSGDIYFHTHREAQNLDRARTQIKLVSDMENCWDEMQRIVLHG